MTRSTSQNKQILEYLQTGRELSSLEALSKFGSFRLASRVSELKKTGHKIQSKTVEVNGKYFSKYFLGTEGGGFAQSCTEGTK
jgi:hypothetical protein